MLTKAQINQLYKDILCYDPNKECRTVGQLLEALTMTEKQRKQTEIAELFLSRAKRERKPKKYSRKERHRNRGVIANMLTEQQQDYEADLYEQMQSVQDFYNPMDDWDDYERVKRVEDKWDPDAQDSGCTCEMCRPDLYDLQFYGYD